MKRYIKVNSIQSAAPISLLSLSVVELPPQSQRVRYERHFVIPLLPPSPRVRRRSQFFLLWLQYRSLPVQTPFLSSEELIVFASHTDKFPEFCFYSAAEAYKGCAGAIPFFIVPFVVPSIPVLHFVLVDGMRLTQLYSHRGQLSLVSILHVTTPTLLLLTPTRQTNIGDTEHVYILFKR